MRQSLLPRTASEALPLVSRSLLPSLLVITPRLFVSRSNLLILRILHEEHACTGLVCP